MQRRGKALKHPYGAYHSARDGHSDEELCRVGHGTPCGEYLRRFWQPVCNAPRGLQFEGTGERPTYCNNTLARVPAPADPEADRRRRIAFGRELTKRIFAGEYSKEEPGCTDPRGLEEIRRALA